MAVVWQPASGAAGGVPAVLVELPRPPVPAVLALHDRSVYIADMQQPPSGFVLARRWVRNDPDTDVESVPQQQSSVALPRPGVAGVASGESEAPQFPDDSDDYNPEESVKRLKRHWVGVRRHDTEQRLQRLQQSSGERLRVLSGVAVPQIQQLALPLQAVHAGALPEQQQPVEQQQQLQVKQEQQASPAAPV